MFSFTCHWNFNMQYKMNLKRRQWATWGMSVALSSLMALMGSVAVTSAQAQTAPKRDA